jgi:regulatory protein
LDLAHRYLNHRDRTEAEIRRRLAGKGIDGTIADLVIQTLTEDGYLDDARFARLFAQDKRTLERWGSDRIKHSLLARGVDGELVEETLRDGEAQETELTRAVSLLRRRFPAPPGDRRERDRQLGVLARKGFDSELALEALSMRTRDARR